MLPSQRDLTVPDDPKKPTEDEVNDGFKVDVPDALLEEAVEAVNRRVAEAVQVNTGDEEGDLPGEVSVEVEASATDAEAARDIEDMSVDELLRSGFLPDKIVAAFLEERTRSADARKQADAAREKIAAFLAESESFRKRLTREKDDAIRFANEKVLLEMLPVVDNLERALAHSEAGAAGSIREGVEITLRQFNHVLQKVGVTRVDASVGTPFDPRFHEAVAQQESKDLPAGSVAAVLQGGFLLHDRLLRPAMVAVAKGGPTADVPARAEAGGAPTAGTDAQGGAPHGETPEQRLERIRKAGQAAREARLKRRAEESARSAADGGVPASAETPDEKLARIRKTGQAAREARLARKREASRARQAEATEREQAAAAAEDARRKETPEEKLARVRKAGQAAREAREAKRRERDRGDGQSVASAEAKEAKKEVAGETPEQKLERIRRVGEAAREARRKKRAAEEAAERAAAEAQAEDEAAAEAEAAEAAAAPARTETPEEKLERIRRVGEAAREARRKRRESASSAEPTDPIAAPAFEDGDLDNWESAVDSVRTDKS